MNSKSYKAEKWDMLNEILNTVKKAAGLPLTDPETNPHRHIK